MDTIEHNILEIVRDNNIKSRHHLLGYAVNYQGFYGYGDMQLIRLINKLSIFFSETKDELKLNRQGHEALINHHNFATYIKNNIQYGGVRRLDFQFSISRNNLVKTIVNAY